jgi:hypothetical protein
MRSFNFLAFVFCAAISMRVLELIGLKVTRFHLDNVFCEACPCHTLYRRNSLFRPAPHKDNVALFP